MCKSCSGVVKHEVRVKQNRDQVTPNYDESPAIS